MTVDAPQSISDHFSQQARIDEYLISNNPMNEARRDLVRRRLLANLNRGDRVLEIGCGIGTLTAELAAAGMNCIAIDISAEMVKHAQATVGIAARVEQGDVFAYAPANRFAAVVANGVAPYYPDCERFVRRIAELTEPGGIAAIVHRNALFNLFALNRGTIDFIVDDLLAQLPPSVRAHVAGELHAVPGLDLPRRESSSSQLRRASQNPLTIADLYAGAGFAVQEIRYCFVHGMPPRFGAPEGLPDSDELQRRYEDNWRGMFLGSQFLIIAKQH
jgi:2-polyprenyl-3-methyl-5-hydroxy-6-metoxy-1,4-benzoquinol methylase